MTEENTMTEETTLAARIAALESKVGALAHQLDAPTGVWARLEALEARLGPAIGPARKRAPTNSPDPKPQRRKIIYRSERLSPPLTVRDRTRWADEAAESPDRAGVPSVD